MSEKKIKTALISVFHKEGLREIAGLLNEKKIRLLSTGGTASFLRNLGFPVQDVSELTNFPEIFGGRVKTLHPVVMGGILNRRNHPEDTKEKKTLQIPDIDLVVVDLYPFEQTLKENPEDESSLIEKIDIGGVSLIRAAAKNFHDVLVIPSFREYPVLLDVLSKKDGTSTLELRKSLAARAFEISSMYDALIGSWLSGTRNQTVLRYGENPHQKAVFRGNLEQCFEKLSGKELSYNNLLDLDSALGLSFDLGNDASSCVIVKHNNPCGVALRNSPEEAWEAALACDPVSAFGGIIVLNSMVSAGLAKKIHSVFFEVLLAPSYEEEALRTLTSRQGRIILQKKEFYFSSSHTRSALNGILIQDRDEVITAKEHLRPVTEKIPSDEQMEDLVFAQRIVKHARSNAIVLAREKTLLGIGIGQTSRVDALRQAIEKARRFGFSLRGAVMASDAFFPFPDCVEMAQAEGIYAVIQPGGSIRDKESIDFCNRNGMAMVFTGIRHFKH